MILSSFYFSEPSKKETSGSILECGTPTKGFQEPIDGEGPFSYTLTVFPTLPSLAETALPNQVGIQDRMNGKDLA